MSTRTTVLAIGCWSLALVSAPAAAGPCDARYAFDGDLTDTSGNGMDGRMIGAGGVPAVPQFADGKFGQALLLDGSSAMRSFIDLSDEACPQVTMTAWINIEPTTSAQVIVWTGNGPGLSSAGSHLSMKSTGNGLIMRDVVTPYGGWMFVAGVWDNLTLTHRLHVRGRNVSGPMSGILNSSGNGMWLGAANDKLSMPPGKLLIDDLRIYGAALPVDEVLAIRDAGPGDPQQLMSGPAPAPGTGGDYCASGLDCRFGTYCASDHTCHPNSHLPLTSASTSEPLISPTTSIPDIDRDSPTDILAGAGTASSSTPQADSATVEAAEEEYTGGFHPGDEPVTTALSGFSGNIVRTIELYNRFYGQIVWANSAQYPCRISIRNTGPFGDTETLEFCEYDEAYAVEVKPIIRSLRVCTNSTTRRLRGLQVWAAVLDSDGRRDLTTTDTKFIEGCNAWHSEVACPADHLATGLEVHAITHSGGGRDIVGLRLVCREVVRDFP